MECSKCKSNRNVKNGHINGLQRYKCKDCGVSKQEATGMHQHFNGSGYWCCDSCPKTGYCG